jgi:hypothetical protein
LSEPNEATTAEPVAAEATAPDANPDKSSNTQNATPFWKRWLGKS